MLRDVVLFTVVFGSVGVAVLAPETGTIFQPYILYFMMALLFLSFLRIDLASLFDASRITLRHLFFLSFAKLVLLPSVLYWVTLSVYPDLALAVLLLSGISTGVVAPFVATLLAADVAFVTRMVVVTSLLVPFSLPALVKLLAGQEITIPMDVMVQLLSCAIFFPLIAVIALRRVWPRFVQHVIQRQFHISLVFFALINLGVFSKYSQFFFQNPTQILLSLGVSYVLATTYYLVGFLITPAVSPGGKLSAGISLALMNNVLVIVFSSEFFGPLPPTLAAMYMFPFFTMIAPVRILASRFQWLSEKKGETG